MNRINAYFYDRIVLVLTFFCFAASFNTPIQAAIAETYGEIDVLLHSANESRGNKKAVCVCYGNCQMGVVCDYLKENYPDTLDCTMVINYSTIADQSLLPVELLKQADIFIFQPIKGYGKADTLYIQNHYLKKSCRTVSFAYLYFSGYFPDYFNDMNNNKTIAPLYPFGEFGYGHSKIQEFVLKGHSPSEIIHKCLNDKLFDKSFIKSNIEKTLNILAKKEKITDIKFAEYIRKNFRKHKLFHAVNHPTNYLLEKLIAQIVDRLNLKNRGIKNNPFFNQERLIFNATDIIYPSVANILKLEFDISQARCHYADVSTIEYIDAYIRSLYPEHYFSF